MIEDGSSGDASAEAAGETLSCTLGRTHRVGSDVEDVVAPLGWSFILPTRELRAAVEVAPAITGSLDGVSSSEPVRAVSVDELAGIAPGSLDLVDLGAIAASGVDDPSAVASVVAAALASDGVVRADSTWTEPLSSAGVTPARRFWASPAPDPVAFVPAHDNAMIERFRAAGRIHGGYAHVRGERSDREPEAGSILLFGADPQPGSDGPPGWLVNAAGRGVDISEHRWGVWARRNYSSQKVVVFLHRDDESDPDIVVKIPRIREFNHRLETEADAIASVSSIPALAPTVPETVFTGWHAGLFMLGSRGVSGPSMPEVTTGGPECPVSQRVIEWVTLLATETARPVPPGDVAAALAQVVDRFAGLYDPRPELGEFLVRQVDLVADASVDLPMVRMHGNVSDWNVLVPPDGPLVMVDWEFSEATAPPLWDLFYFLRMDARRLNTGWRRRVLRRRVRTDTFLDGRDGGAFGMRIDRYCDAVGVPSHIVEPLFHLCWVHLCLNEATHRTPDRLARASKLAVLERGVALSRAGRLEALLRSPRRSH